MNNVWRRQCVERLCSYKVPPSLCILHLLIKRLQKPVFGEALLWKTSHGKHSTSHVWPQPPHTEVILLCDLNENWVVRKINFHSNLFLLTANMETRITLCLGLSFLHTINNSIIALSLEHSYNLHQSQRTKLPWNKKSALFILPGSLARNQDLLLVLALFSPITHALCHFNIDFREFALQVYDVYKQMYRQFAFSCFGEVYRYHIH